MKEASGEANLTVVTIILIGVIVAIATPLITNLMNSTKAKADCLASGKNEQECSKVVAKSSE